MLRAVLAEQQLQLPSQQGQADWAVHEEFVTEHMLSVDVALVRTIALSLVCRVVMWYVERLSCGEQSLLCRYMFGVIYLCVLCCGCVVVLLRACVCVCVCVCICMYVCVMFV